MAGGLADDVRERRLGPRLLLQVEVLLLEPALERRDLFVREHVLDGEDDLVRDREQELGVALAVPSDLPAPDVQRADDLALGSQGHRKSGENPSWISGACSTNRGSSLRSAVSRGARCRRSSRHRLPCRGHVRRRGE